ncbi:MAG: DUF3501 family protein [Bacteroidota bacterium]|nr:DUF3501 family protein [Bacteroidota bacterium]MDP4231897.1 DUF3501 family protein [Bacteroidota bacterium]MDP4241396.1 DUF3501 family protein [Bacteroidota bacterium]MDP4287319.1 DUF3501 family protein [Bacteroidota bacterium]
MPITLTDILDIAQYEKIRPELRKRVIEEKRHRRVQVGPVMTFVFENRMTVQFQIQEMLRTERLVHDEAIQHEIDTYSKLLPSRNELSATLLVEITEKEKIKPTLDSLVGLTENSIFLVIGEWEIATQFDEEQSEEGRISAVQYVRWHLTDQDVERIRFGQSDVSLIVRHPNYRFATQLTNEQRESIARDLSEPV